MDTNQLVVYAILLLKQLKRDVDQLRDELSSGGDVEKWLKEQQLK